MDVNEFWIIFQCNLVWKTSSVRPWIRDMMQILSCPLLSSSEQPRRGCLLSLTKTGLLHPLHMQCILPNIVLNCKDLNPCSYIQDLPRSADVSTCEWQCRATKCTRPLWTYPWGLLHIIERLHRPLRYHPSRRKLWKVQPRWSFYPNGLLLLASGSGQTPQKLG